MIAMFLSELSFITLNSDNACRLSFLEYSLFVAVHCGKKHGGRTIQTEEDKEFKNINFA